MHPDDVEELLQDIRVRLGVAMFAGIQRTRKEEAVRYTKGDLARQMKENQGACHFFHLARSLETQPAIRTLQVDDGWLVQLAGETIQFDGFSFSNGVLHPSQMQYQINWMDEGTVVQKRDEFRAWAQQVFQLTRQHCAYSVELNSYVGRQASRWKDQGGVLFVHKIKFNGDCCCSRVKRGPEEERYQLGAAIKWIEGLR